MGDVVWPNFRHEHTSFKTQVPGEEGPEKIYGSVGAYHVALFCDDLPDVFPTFRVKLLGSDTGEAFLLATLPVTQESRFEAHAIAAAVLEALRIAVLTVKKP